MVKRYTVKPRIVIFVLTAILVVFSVQFYEQNIMLKEKKAELNLVEEEISDVQNYNLQLQNSIDYYQSGEYKEEMEQRELDKLQKPIVIFNVKE